MGQHESSPEVNVKRVVCVKRSHTLSPNRTKPSNYPTRSQCCILQKSWNRALKSGPVDIGQRVMLRIFENNPSIKMIGGLMDASTTDIKYNPKFQYLSGIFTKALSRIISKLNEPEEVLQYCRELGRKHVRHVKKGFRLHCWDTFAESLTECAIEWEGGQRCKEALNGWRKLVIFITNEMKIGFQEEKKRLSLLNLSFSPEVQCQKTLSELDCSFRSRTLTD